MYDICCIGHITLDKVQTPETSVFLPGGTAYYFSAALRRLDARYLLITALADTEMHFVEDLRRQGVEVRAFRSCRTVFFENIYQADPDQRSQNVLCRADPFSLERVTSIDARYYHLGPLLSDDVPAELIPFLAKKGIVSLDVQGYLRRVQDQKVYATDWTAKRVFLPYVSILKADEAEMTVLTGTRDVREGARMLADWGVREVVITSGSGGSTLYHDGVYDQIPAYMPVKVVDATGCGDTYMAGYLQQRAAGAEIEQAGHFASAMAGLKTAASGPFNGTARQIRERLSGFVSDSPPCY